MFRKFVVFTLSSYFVLSASLVVGQQDDRFANFRELMADYRETLQLSPQQMNQARPIFIRSLQASAAILKKYGFDANGDSGSSSDRPRMRRQELDNMFKEIQSNQNDTAVALIGIFNPEQMEEYKDMVLEQRAKQARQLRLRLIGSQFDRR